MANNRRHTARSLTMRFSIIVVVAMYAVAVAAVGEDTSVCSQANFSARAQQIPQGPKKPTLPPQYRVRIEGNIIESNYTQDIHEYFDSVNNMGAAHEWINGVETNMLFLYPTGELITLQYDGSGDPPRCHVDILDKSSAKTLFGLTQYSNGSDHIFSANQALRFAGGIPEVYIGRGTARDGIVVDMWESCIYSEPNNATLKLTWYFSANNTWVTAENVVAPEQVDVEGIMHVNSSLSLRVLREYVFTDFQPVDGPVADFETPPGTYCQNRVSTRPMPNVTNTFTFTAEIFEPMNYYLNWIKEYYDWDLNLVRYDYSVDPGTPSPYGNGKLIRVHDFNTGVAYVMDAMVGNCSVTPINATGFDAKSLDAGKVRIRTDKEFFYFSNVPYEYAGQRVVRGINCDVWTARRVGYPAGYPNAISIWEWYFASSEWMENTGISNYFYLPVMLQVTSQAPVMNVIYNIYDYSEGNPNIWQTDISACFNYTNRKAFQLAFPGTYSKDVAANLSKFKFAVVSSIVALGGISPLRISNTQVDFSSGDVLVSFTILDKAPIAGDANTGFIDIPLADAVSAITTSVNTGQFQILLDHASFPSAPGTLTAKKYSASSWDVVVNEYFGTPSKQGYSGGAMAGLGVAMVIIGLCIGFGILFGIYKIRGGTFTNSFSPKTFTEKEME
ncbi:uncharacterized protein LOC124150287 isoform X1 [Haliotis rufescens]|uniref:uncharacterized protein LOC124150287 isoform X1 n=2 Tax=Haliotis rufescens TaxID=6454 RepID=UPI00201FAB9E|nr:uncharacterized protein LOC124150287 isoform X1 [Haliotis rufescens]